MYLGCTKYICLYLVSILKANWDLEKNRNKNKSSRLCILLSGILNLPSTHWGFQGSVLSWEDGAHWPQGHWIRPSFFPLSLLFFFSWLSSNTMCLEQSHFRNQKSYPKILVWQTQKLSFNVLHTGVWLRRDGKEYLKATWKYIIDGGSWEKERRWVGETVWHSCWI